MDNEGEFANWVFDETLPNAMAVVPRQQAKGFVPGRAHVGAAKTRDVTADSVTACRNSVSAESRTKISWVAVRLINRSPPTPFTADIGKDLAQPREDPAVVTTLDVGQIAPDDMARINSSSLADAMDLLSQSSFFLVPPEGFALRGSEKIKSCSH